MLVAVAVNETIAPLEEVASATMPVGQLIIGEGGSNLTIQKSAPP